MTYLLNMILGIVTFYAAFYLLRWGLNDSPWLAIAAWSYGTLYAEIRSKREK